MSKKLRILHLEDDADYMAFVRDLLAAEGLEADITHVITREQFNTAISRDTFDLILADYSLPQFTGLEALATAREVAPRTPFLLVSGTIGEQAAIESLRCGATDYVLKHWPERLMPAVRRAVDEASERAKRKKAETELVRRERYFRVLTNNSLDILSILSRDGLYLYKSPSVQRVLGYTPAELIGRSCLELAHPEDQAALADALAFSLNHPGIPVTLEFRYRHQDGRWIDLEAVGQNRLDDPDVGAIIVNTRDVSERKRAERQRDQLANLGRKLNSVTCPEEAARCIEEAARALFPCDVFLLDLYNAATGKVLAVLAVDTIDGRREEFDCAECSDKLSLVGRRVVEQGAQLILRAAADLPTTDTVPFGNVARRSASLMFVPIRSGNTVIGILSVQTYEAKAYDESALGTLQALADYCGSALERIRAELALRETEQRFRDLFEGSPDAVFVEDFEGRVLDVNPAGCRLHNLSREQLVGMNVSQLVPPGTQDDVMRYFGKLVSGEASRVEGHSYAADQRATPVEVRASRITYGGVPAVLLHVRDISERKDAESALRSSELLFHSVWENSVDGMRLTDENGVVVAVNEAFCKLVGLSRAELEGRPFADVYADATQRELLLSTYKQNFSRRMFDANFEGDLPLQHGQPIVLEHSHSFVEIRGQPPMLLGIFRDVTGQKRLEEQLRQVQKMDAIGQLAGGVAHDFNNILTVIHGHASLLQAAGGLPESSTRSAQQVVQAADRAASLTRQLLAFSRRQMMQPHQLDLNDVVSDMTKMLGRILGEDIALQVTAQPQPAPVWADASMLEQVILNLAVNARDAMPKGGQLLLEISAVEVDARYAASHPEARVGSFVSLTAADTGCGIPPEIQARIFEPFFTTKEVGKGTGLGLATVYGIVKQHHGWLDVSSESGHGAVFRVFLPRYSGPDEQREEKAAEPAVLGGTETILVVEDETPVRELVSSLLQAQGYKILTAETGAQAMEVWRTKKKLIDLVLTDLVMPGRMNGWELAETLWSERPGLKVLFTSGYSAEVVGREFLPIGSRNFLQKPYTPQKLALMVRECLDAEDRVPVS